MKRLLGWFLLLLFTTAALLIGIDAYVSYKAKPYLYEDLSRIPPKKAALLLGTTKYIAKGKKNYFYLYRIEAAVRLWNSGKIKAIVVSGDNGTKYYDETTTMYRDLIKAGVPAKYITRDYAGFRTLDSVVRAGLDFGLSDYIIVSQKFHLERTLFLAHAKGHRAIGLIARDIPGTTAAYRMKLRELLARFKAVLDLYLLDTKPKYYGGKEKVGYKP
jgi:SanA protein